MTPFRSLRAAVTALLLAAPLAAQDVPTGDSIIRKIYDEGMLRSQAWRYGQVLMDSIGPRLTGSPQNRMANDWVVKTYAAMGVTAKNEQYGTWRDWTRGLSRIELLAPRLKNLDALMMPWSPGTPAAGITAEVTIIPPLAQTKDSAGIMAWVRTVRGKAVLTSFPQPTCRPDSAWLFWGGASGLAAMRAQRDTAQREFGTRTQPLGAAGRNLPQLLEQAGAVAILGSSWSRGWGTNKMQSGARTTTIPQFDVGCEDYGLLARLAANDQRPTVRLFADAKLQPQESPVYNTIATVRGSEKPGEYVMLSAHLDSWDAGSGATDNGTGTVVMLEAMRILRAVYPNPKRTIIAGHWSGEEQGDIGSSVWAADHPEVVNNLQALFNQDNGTGNIEQVVSNGFVDAPGFLARWMSRMPADITGNTRIDLPGFAHDESTDSDAFTCRNAPGFQLNSADWDYTTFTWHTGRDTFDKISWAEVRRNAIFVAMMAYLASEDPNTVPRTRRIAPTSGRNAPPECNRALRSYREAIGPRPPA
jgi:hypothetical protein